MGYDGSNRKTIGYGNTSDNANTNTNDNADSNTKEPLSVAINKTDSISSITAFAHFEATAQNDSHNSHSTHNPRAEFDNYISGVEITNQVGGEGPALPMNKTKSAE